MKQVDHLLLKDKIRRVQCLITDVDGVLTDGRLHISDNGELFKIFHVHDGVGLKRLSSHGLSVAVITQSQGPILDTRMQQLGINHVYAGCFDKMVAFTDLQKQLGLPAEGFAYIGDDLPDLPVIQQVGCGLTVNNAVEVVKQHSDYISQRNGGEGAVREICDMILSIKFESSQHPR